MADALYHLDVAQDLLAYAQVVSRQDAIPCIELAISSLELYLTLPPALIALSDELFARLLLAKTLFRYTINTVWAEQVISRAVIKIGHQGQFIEYRLAFNELTCQILRVTGSINAAKKLAKDSIAVCEEQGQSFDKWKYTFLFKLSEMDCSHASIRAVRALATLRRDERMGQVADLLDSVLYIAQGTYVPNAVAPTMPLDLETCDTGSLDMLHYLHLAISVLGDVVAGSVARTGQAEENSKRAQAKLALIHRGLDLNPNIGSSIDIPIPTDSRPDGPTEKLTLFSFSTRRFMIFIYVLSGLVHLAEITSSRSEKFFAEGLRQLEVEVTESRETVPDPWLQTMAEIIHVYQSFNHLLHYRFDACRESLRQTSQDSPLVQLLRGSLAQQLGDLDEALRLYEPLIRPITAPAELRNQSSLASSSTTTTGISDTAVLACLNTVTILLGPSHLYDRDRRHDLLLRLEPYCQAGPLGTIFELLRTLAPLSSTTITTTTGLVGDASQTNTNTTTSTTTSLALKRSLTRVLAAAKVHGNTQLNMIALSVLSLQGGDPGEMVLKFSFFAMNQANKSTTLNSHNASAASGVVRGDGGGGGGGGGASHHGQESGRGTGVGVGVSVWASLNGSIVEDLMMQKVTKSSSSSSASSSTAAGMTGGTGTAELQEKLAKVRAVNRRNEEIMRATMPLVHKALSSRS